MTDTTENSPENTPEATRPAHAPRAAGERPSRTPAVAGERPARPARVAKPNGQWKIDGQEPLNSNEELKQADNGLNVRERIEKIYSKEGFDAIPTDDLHGRFRWWGLYTQRRPGIDGGRTAKLETHELEDKYFMLRVRIDGGRLTLEQLRTIAQISIDFGRNTADISDRQNIQLHWIEVENVPEIWRRLEAVGLHTTEACGDVPRVVLGSPVAGIAKEELIDVRPLIDEITEKYIGIPELSNLPRKFKTAITGHPSLDVVHEINDVAFTALEHPELGIGFDLWVAGGLSANPRLGERLGAFVKPEQVADVWHGVAQIFRDYGYRRLRNKARLKFLLADWGTEKFRQILQDEYLGYALPDGPPSPQPRTPGDHVGVHEQKDGRYYIGVAPYVGRSSGTTLLEIAEYGEKIEAQGVRLTPHQKLLLIGVKKDDVAASIEKLRSLGLEAEPSAFRRNTMACTGIEFCKLAIVDTKDTATAAIKELEYRLGDLSRLRPITLNVNGCPNSCARLQTADIGLKGQLIMNDEGEQVPGFQVHLGGGLRSTERDEAGMGRTVRGLKVTSEELPDYVEKVVKRYEESKIDDETFAHWAHRVEEEVLQ